MANCKHECCGTAEKVWLPYECEGRSRREYSVAWFKNTAAKYQRRGVKEHLYS